MSSFSFGGATPAASTFSFGGSATPATSSFGGQQAAAPASSSFSFGGGTGGASTSSFGASTPSFGASTPSFGASTPSFGASSFGSSSTPSFGGGASSFGSSATPSFGASSFGASSFGAASTPSLFGSSTAQASPALFNSIGATTPAQQVAQSITRISTELRSDKFKHMLYNLVDAVPNNLQRPADVSEKMWNQAMIDNPDRSRLVPVQLCGFEALKKRLEDHKKTILEHEKFLQSVQQLINSLLQKNERETKPKILQFKEKHMEQCHRLLKIVSKVECFQNRGRGMTPEEELFHSKLTSMQRELNKPTQFQGRLNELTSLVSMQEDISPAVPEELDAESAENIELYLEHQKNGIEQLLKLLKEDLQDVEITLQSLKDGSVTNK